MTKASEREEDACDATRRWLLRLAFAAPLALSATAAMADDGCANLDALPAGQKSLRKSLNFMTVSDDAKRQCGACVFFTAPQNGCGHCGIFNGPVPATGRCDSWSSR